MAQEYSPSEGKALIEDLGSKDENVRVEAENKLLNMGEAVIPELGAVFLGTDDELALKSAAILAEIGPASIPIFTNILGDERFPPNSPRNNTAVEALSRIGITAVPAMFEACLAEGEFISSAYALMDSVRQMGPSAIPALEDVARNENPAIRYLASIVLGDTKDEAAVSTLTQLLKDDSNTVRSSAAIALKKLGAKAKAAVPSLLYVVVEKEKELSTVKETAELKSEPFFDFRTEAVDALGKIDPEAEEVFTVLIKIVGDDNPAVRTQVVTTLGRMRSKAKMVVPILIEALRDRNANVRRAAAAALGQIGPEAKAVMRNLIYALTDVDGRVRKETVAALERISPESEEVYLSLVNIVGDKYPAVRSQAVSAFGKMRQRANTVVPILIQASRDSDSEVRKSAAAALGQIGPEARAAVPHLIKALTDVDGRVRKEAIVALGKIGPEAKDCVPSLIEVLKTEDDDIREQAAQSLRTIGSAAVPSLIVTLQEPKSAIRLKAVWALGGIKPRALEAVPVLIDMLKDVEPTVRKEAANALGQTGEKSEEAVTSLVQALKDENSTVRREAANALGKIWQGAQVAVHALTEALRDENSEVRSSSASTLGRIAYRTQEVFSALTQALKQDDNPGVRSNAANALGLIRGDTLEVVSALTQALKQDDNSGVRSNVANALGLIGAAAKSALPALRDVLKNKDSDRDLAVMSADALANIAKALQDAKDIKSVPELEQVYQALVENPDLNSDKYPQDEHAKSVQRAIEYLDLIWWQQVMLEISDCIHRHPWKVGLCMAYVLWIITCLFLLWCRPLTLLRINDFISPFEVNLPDWLSGRIPLRHLLFVGFINYSPRVLDAWVDRNIVTAREKFAEKGTVRDRKVHIPATMTLDNRVVSDLQGKDLKPTFKNRNACLLIWGEGGSGKTSLACQVAKLAMAETREMWISEHPMLPVLIEYELDSSGPESNNKLSDAIGRQLQLLTDLPEPIHEDLLGHLLRLQRILVIVDHFSEMGEETRAAINPTSSLFTANALIVTSRLKENLGGPTLTTIKPLRIKGDSLSSFMEAYLTHRQKRELFKDAEFFDACSMLSSMVGEREITILLAKLYAEQMIAKKEGASDTELPKNIPDLMLSYLNEINRGVAAANRIDDAEVHRCAKATAWECLRHSYRPAPAKISDVLKAIDGNDDSLKYLEYRLRLVETVQPKQDRIRFLLDPLAEYLACLHLIDIYQENEERWWNFLNMVNTCGANPREIKGFLLAVLDCCLTKQEDGQLPSFLIQELSEWGSRNYR